METNHGDLGTILIDGFYGRGNAGDEAILAAIIQQINSYDPDAEIIVSTFDQEYTKNIHGPIQTVPRYIPSDGIPCSDWLSGIMRADQLWIGGGGLFGDLKMLKYATEIAVARTTGTRVATIAVGSGPIKTDPLGLTKTMLNHADALTVRDSRSKEFLGDIGVNSHIDIVPDPVFAYSSDPSVEPPTVVDGLDSEKTIIVSTREPNKRVLDDTSLATALDDAAAELDCQIAFLPFHDEPIPDSEVARRVANHMTSETIVCDQPLSFREIFATIEDARLVVGMRLHSIIFAACIGTPFVGIPYAPKCESHLERLNTESNIWCDSIDSEYLTSIILNRWENGFEPATKNAIDTFTKRAEKTIPLIQSRKQEAPRQLLPHLIGKIGIAGATKLGRQLTILDI